MIKNWQSKYFEKTAKESHTNVFRSLEIESYLKQLLKKKKIQFTLSPIKYF